MTECENCEHARQVLIEASKKISMAGIQVADIRKDLLREIDKMREIVAKL